MSRLVEITYAEDYETATDCEDDDYLEDGLSSTFSESPSCSEDEDQSTTSETSESDNESNDYDDTESLDSRRASTQTQTRMHTRTRSQAQTITATRSQRVTKRRRVIHTSSGSPLTQQAAQTTSTSQNRRQRRKTRRPERLADWMVPLAQEADWSHQPQSYVRGDEVVVVHISHLGAEQVEEARAARAELKRQCGAGGKRKAQKKKCPTCRLSVEPPFKIFSVPEAVTVHCPVCGEEKKVATDEVTLSCGHSLCKGCFDRIPTRVAKGS